MILYNLVCDKRHEFESWFPNSSAYDKQARRGLVSCPVCGSAKVEKAIMAPRLARKDKSTSILAPAEESASAAAENVPSRPSRCRVALTSIAVALPWFDTTAVLQAAGRIASSLRVESRA